MNDLGHIWKTHDVSLLRVSASCILRPDFIIQHPSYSFVALNTNSKKSLADPGRDKEIWRSWRVKRSKHDFLLNVIHIGILDEKVLNTMQFLMK